MAESELFKHITSLSTEQNNPASSNIDIATTREILSIINTQDKLVADAVEIEIDNIAVAVDGIVDRFKREGRLFYFGAGTSGRLGVLDASECPPTFGSDPELVQGRIAGGTQAMFVAQEGAEDDPQSGVIDVIESELREKDICCGIAASGRTPYVLGALQKASEIGCFTILVTTAGHNSIEQMGVKADVIISPNVGPEVVAGSTRMKSGTAQKLVLNMLTTAAMVRMGKTFGNVMVDLKQTNAKLKERSKKIIMSICDVDYDTASKLLVDSGHHVKTAIVMSLLNCSREDATNKLNENDGFIKKAIE
ncbi:MAG: N-acetylmuramic acid 6-phosphate etherase [Ignavibacteriae bacterium]|nr:N-acetylmuramic acid 6-phosphate etherase [Ignavibacteriota bacterium]MCB9221457.1 N-acetylmuramic acid 6-phosphate etherase [Ignavibacteria bacterium]